MIKSSIFKSYDVRGIYPDQFNENTAYHIGRAFVKHTGAKKVVVGHDARLSSPELFRALAEGITSAGSDVWSIGMVPTECLYFAVASYDFDSGIMITASHNPKEYNGFKTMVRRGNDIVWVRGKDLFSSLDQNGLKQESHGAIGEKNIWHDYISHILKFSGKTRPLKVAVDASNGVMGEAVGKIKKDILADIFEINFEPDGNFPNHSPNPLNPGSTDQIAAVIKKERADLGIIFDGDGDRVFLVDEKGNLVPADITLLLLAKNLLLANPGSAIAYNAICSKAVPEFIKKWGGLPVRTAVGFVNVREGLMKNKGIMGGELSAHYCFRDNFYTDSGMIAFLTLLQIISNDEKPVSEMVKQLSVYFKSAEINFEIEDKEKVLEDVKDKYSDGKQDFLDGVTVEYPDWWFNVRASNTEPLLRLTVEADTQSLLDQKKKELSGFIGKMG